MEWQARGLLFLYLIKILKKIKGKYKQLGRY